MLTLPREIVKNWELIWTLAIKELRVRYKRSVLGFLWALLNPLFMTIILTIVFSAFAPSIQNYSIFVMSAIFPWTFFSQSLSYSVESIVGNGDLLKKVYVDKSVFPVAAVVSNLINFVFMLIPLVLLLFVLRFPFYKTWLYLPVPLTGLLLFALGCSFFFAAANVFFRDIAHMLQVILQGWYFISPVMYSLDMLPKRYLLLFRLNPMLYVLNGFRMAIYYGQLPTPQSAAACLVCGFVALILGYGFFRRYENAFVFYV